MKLSNPHTHSLFCDGKNTLEEMIERAEELGFVSLGFSSHASQTANNFYGLRDEKAYIENVRRLQKENDRIRIHLGVELDAVAWCDREKYDYILGGFHYLSEEKFFYPADGSRASIQAGIDHLYGGDPIRAAKAFFRSVAEACENLKPDIVAHYDLINKNNEDGTLFDIDHPDYRAAALEGLEAVKACGALLEVNTGAMARGYRTTPYPYPFVLKRWKEMGGRVILGSDCHNRDFLNYGYDAAVQLIQAAGFDSVVRLGGFGEALFVEEGIK